MCAISAKRLFEHGNEQDNDEEQEARMDLHLTHRRAKYANHSYANFFRIAIVSPTTRLKGGSKSLIVIGFWVKQEKLDAK